MNDDTQAKIKEYDRRYLNNALAVMHGKFFTVRIPPDGAGYTADVNGLLALVEQDRQVFIYADEDHNPVAVMMPMHRYGELVAAERSNDAKDGQR